MEASSNQQGSASDDQQERYPGEDVRPTSAKELFGFYAYSFAAEVFIVCGIGSFIPITLEGLARQRGFLQSDRTIPCSGGALHSASSLYALDREMAQCMVPIFGRDINTASFAMYTFSISVLFQSIIVITFSGAADHGEYRKTLLLTFAFVGAVSTMLFLPITSEWFLLAALCAIIGNICCASSFVLLNSFLPLLVRYHPDRWGRESPALIQDGSSASRMPSEPRHAGERSPLLSSTVRRTLQPSSFATLSQDLELSTKISSYGMGVGYLGAVTLQALSILIVITTGSSTWSLRLVLFVVGLWWLIFTIPAAVCLRPRPGPPLSAVSDAAGKRTWIGYLLYAWVNLGRTFLRARRLRDVLLFLGAWFMISDAIATVSGTAVLFAKTTLGMSPAALAAINVITTVSGVVGAFSWSKVSRVMGLSPTQTILACIFLFELIPLYGLLGFIPAVRRAGVGGLQQPWEMYPLGAVYGLVLGGLGSYCRSLYGELIPQGSEAAFYALYAVTDKGSSIFGPVVVGLITDATGEIRQAFFFLAALIALPIPLLWAVDVERGKREGAALGKAHVVFTTEPQIESNRD